MRSLQGWPSEPCMIVAAALTQQVSEDSEPLPTQPKLQPPVIRTQAMAWIPGSYEENRTVTVLLVSI